MCGSAGPAFIAALVQSFGIYRITPPPPVYSRVQVALDVDKDLFDKFSLRHNIDCLLMELWKVSRVRLGWGAKVGRGTAGAGHSGGS